jgi:PXPV repeat-containing protein
MNWLRGRIFIIVMTVIACVTATGCFSCTEERVVPPKVVVQPAPVVVAPAPVVVQPTP